MPKTVTKQKISEADVSRCVTDLLRAKRIRFHRLNAGTRVFEASGNQKRRVIRMQEKGCADFLALIRQPNKNWPHVRAMDRNVPLYLEIKAPGKKQTPEQIEFQKQVEEYGMSYLLVDDPEVLIRWMKERNL